MPTKPITRAEIQQARKDLQIYVPLYRAERVKDGTGAFYYIDFQDEKNAKLAKGYDVSGPALIVRSGANLR